MLYIMYSSQHNTTNTRSPGYEFSRDYFTRTLQKSRLSTLESMAAGALAGLYAGLESALFGITVTNFVYYYCKHVVYHV